MSRTRDPRHIFEGPLEGPPLWQNFTKQPALCALPSLPPSWRERLNFCCSRHHPWFIRPLILERLPAGLSTVRWLGPLPRKEGTRSRLLFKLEEEIREIPKKRIAFSRPSWLNFIKSLIAWKISSNRKLEGDSDKLVALSASSRGQEDPSRPRKLDQFQNSSPKLCCSSEILSFSSKDSLKKSLVEDRCKNYTSHFHFIQNLVKLKNIQHPSRYSNEVSPPFFLHKPRLEITKAIIHDPCITVIPRLKERERERESRADGSYFSVTSKGWGRRGMRISQTIPRFTFHPGPPGCASARLDARPGSGERK